MTTKKEKTMQDIHDELVECMVGRGLYEETLEPMLWDLAALKVRFSQVNAAMAESLEINNKSREGKDRIKVSPAASLLVPIAEEIRKYMRDLGLAVAKPAGFVATEKDPRSPAGDKLMSMMAVIGGKKKREFKMGKKEKTPPKDNAREADR